MSGNGNGPLKFPVSAVPIIGQVFTPTNGFVTATGYCGCGGTQTGILLVGASVATCPACRRGFAIKQLAFDRMTGQMQVVVDLVSAPPLGGDVGRPV
jgi:hypothetical protein